MACPAYAALTAARALMRPQPNSSSRPAGPRSVAVPAMICATWSALSAGLPLHTREASPATKGDAMEVPEA